MSRRFTALVILGAAFTLILLVIWRVIQAAEEPLMPMLTILAAAFATGRLIAWLNRDLIRPRRFFALNKMEEAEAAATAAIQRYDAEPWRAWFAYLLLSFDGWNARALALNMRGVARLRLGQLDAAEADLKAACALDPGYAKPIYTLGVIATLRGDPSEAERLFAQAARLGFTHDRGDRMIASVVDLYANTGR